MVRDKSALETPKKTHTQKKYRCRRGSPEPSVSNQTSPASFCFIPLTQGKFAIVDAEDYVKLSKYNWRCHIGHLTYYAIRGNGKNRIFMHTQIKPPPEGMEIDHVNGKGYDNRKINIRHCTRNQNMQNRHKRARGTSYYKGIYLEKNTNRWRAQIIVNGKRYRLGRYNSEIDAAKAYDKKAKELLGKYACTNF